MRLISHCRGTPVAERARLCQSKKRQLVLTVAVAAVLIAPGFASAQNLTGTVINRTVNKPAAGDEVVLLTLSADGMHEGARTRSDRSGHFSLPLDDARESHVVRVIHQGVTYHRRAEPGTSSVTVQIFEVGDKVDGIAAVMDVERIEAKDDILEVKQLITMRNASRPPRTLMNERPFEIQLPPEAQVQTGLVQYEAGQPLKQPAVPGERKGQYHFIFPLRPGDTRFAVIYRLPYNGKAMIEPIIRNPLERFVVMLPKSMAFEPTAAGIFQSMPGVSLDNVQGTRPMQLGEKLAFGVSGTGVLAELQGRKQSEIGGEQVTKPDESKRPGGGLGAPSELPDPLHAYRWLILIGLSTGLIAGAWYISRLTPVGPPTPQGLGHLKRQQRRTILRKAAGGDRQRRLGLR